MDIFVQIKAVLTSAERVMALKLLCLMVVGMLLEMIGVGIVIPFIALFIQDAGPHSSQFLSWSFAYFGEMRNVDLFILAIGGLVSLYLLKNIFLAYSYYRQVNFAFGVQRRLSSLIFSNYLHQPYSFHLEQNSAQLIRNATSETNYFAGHALMSSIQLLAELLVIIGLVGLLIVIEPLGTIFVGFSLGIVVMIFFKFTNNRVTAWGTKRQFHEGARIQHLQQGLGGIKEVIFSRKQGELLLAYGNHNRPIAEAAMKQAVLKNIPRLVLECIALTGLLILTIIMANQDKTLEDIVPVVGAFIAAAFRLMPSINRILGAVQILKFMAPVVETVHSQVRLESSNVDRDFTRFLFDREIRIEGLKFSYQAEGRLVLDIPLLTIEKGRTIGFVGPSGSGKSTLINTLLGLLQPDCGRILVDSQDINVHSQMWFDKVGYVSQSIFLIDDTLRRNIAFGEPDSTIDESALLAAVEAAQLTRFIEELPEGLSTNVGERGIRLSGGQVQRLAIARAMYRDPELLVLDEATSSLDHDTEREVMDPVIAMKGVKTIIIVAHRLSTVEHCDYIYRLKDGRIIEEGRPSDVLKTIAG